jgi:hypothetical protein
MSTRNEDRMGVKDVAAGQSPLAAVQQEPQTEPKGFNFNFALPTEFVELPSKGRFYPEGHPLKDQEVVEIKHMTTKEEDILNSQTLIKKGLVFERLLASVLIDSSIDSSSLLVADRNAVLIAVRAINYGIDYEPEVACPSCEQKSIQSFNLQEFSGLDDDEQTDIPVNIEKTADGTFLVKDLPVSNWSFEIKPLTGQEENAYTKILESDKKRKKPESLLSTQIKLYTVAIDGVDDPKIIDKAVSVLPAKDSKILRASYKKIAPRFDMGVVYDCDNCGYSGRIEMPFTAEFFWSKR